MRRRNQQMVLFLLVCSLLTGSVGMATTQRFCAMMGIVSSSAAAEKMEEMGCCAKKKQTPSCPEAAAKLDKQACCATSTTHQKLDVTSSLKFSTVEFLTIIPALTNPFLLPPSNKPVLSRAFPRYSDPSPPLAGRDLLHRLHILNI